MVVPGEVSAATKKAVATKKKVVYANCSRDLYNKKCKYADEKVEFSNPKSKCDTAVMRKLHAQKVAQAIKDSEKYDVSPSSTSPYVEPYKIYADGLIMLWDAMEEPYCGYGAFGASATKRSYEKNANRLRTTFLASVKKIQKNTVKEVVNTTK